MGRALGLPVPCLTGIEAAFAQAVVLYTEREETARRLALHGVRLTVQAQTGCRRWRRARARDCRLGRRVGMIGSVGATGNSLVLTAGAPLLEALVAVRLCVHRDIEGAARRSTADLYQRQL